MSDKIREALAGMLAIVDESRGVEGYHLNGDIAEWDEFPEIEAAREALAQQPAQAVPDQMPCFADDDVGRHAFSRGTVTVPRELLKRHLDEVGEYAWDTYDELRALLGKDGDA